MTYAVYTTPETVVEDVLGYRRKVEKFLAGTTSEVAFRAIRVPMGIYEQRVSGTFMVRVRGAAGIFLPSQVMRIAELAAEYGSGIVHVTTRQDLQIHGVRIEDTPAVLEKLLEAGLSSRGGGGNTVRNVSACPYAGLCTEEVFDVTPYAIALTQYLISERANFNLPRKFKTAFSSCREDCALASVADLGFFAHEKDGIKGFSVYAGGGMGAHSALAVRVEEFIPAESIFEVAEAVKRLFDKHGDRANRHSARLRFVLQRVGEEEFVRLYREELAQVRRETIKFPELPAFTRRTEWAGGGNHSEPTDTGYHRWKSANVAPENRTGFAVVRLPLQLGDIDSASLYALAELADALGDGSLRTTQDQNLHLTGVPDFNLPRLYESLKHADESLIAPQTAGRTVACAGASTCKLGLCLSRGLAQAIEDALQDIDVPFADPIRISGCPNSCGQHPIAPIGFYGSAVRVDGRLVPVYALVAGGHLEEGNARLSEVIARTPAKNVPALLRDFWLGAAENTREGESFDELLGRWGIEYLRNLGKKYEPIPLYEEAPGFYRDFGTEEDFSLAGRGPGECGAGVTDVIALDVTSAKQSLESGTLYDALLSASRALLVIRGVQPGTDHEVFDAFSRHFIDPGWVSDSARELIAAALGSRNGHNISLESRREDVRELVLRVEQLFLSLDSGMNFRVEPIKAAEVHVDGAGFEIPPHQSSDVLDLRGVACPMNFVRAKLHLEDLEVGSIADILLDEGEPVQNVPPSLEGEGQEVISIAPEDGHFRVTVKKAQ